MPPVEGGGEKRSKHSEGAKSPLRGHVQDKECNIEISKDLSGQHGETKHGHNASFMQASLLCLTVSRVHSGPTSDSGHHPQSLGGKTSECLLNLVLGSSSRKTDMSAFQNSYVASNC